MHVSLTGVWIVPDDACDGLDAPRRVLGAVPGLHNAWHLSLKQAPRQIEK
jgi:hypothetical protein